MSEEFKHYVISLYQDIPQEVYEGLFIVSPLREFSFVNS